MKRAEWIGGENVRFRYSVHTTICALNDHQGELRDINLKAWAGETGEKCSRVMKHGKS